MITISKYCNYLIFIFFALFITTSAEKTLQKTDSSSIVSNIIYVASEPDYPPYCIVNAEGKADGFSVDLFKEAAKAVDLKVNIKIGIWSQIKNELAEGKIDALPLVGKTPEREKFFDFSLPYLTLHGAIFVKDGNSDIKSLHDLKNKSIVVMKGDNAEEFVRRESISNYIFTTNTYEEAFQKLNNGEYDVVITQRITGLELLENMGLDDEIHPLDLFLPEYSQEFCFAVKKGDTQLLERLNEGLSIIIANNTFEKIRIKWFGPAIKESIDLWDIVKIILYGLVPIAIILASVMLIVLRREVRERTKKLTEEVAQHKETFEKLKEQQIITKKNEQQIRLLLNSTGDGICGINLDGNCTFINHSAIKMLGYNSDKEILGKNVHELIHHSTKDGTPQEETDCRINKAFLNGEGVHSKSEVFWKADGTYFYVNYSSYPIIDNNEVIGAVVSFSDISESQKLHEDLHETKEYLENLITYANAPIVVWNTEFKIERFNKAFENLTGRDYRDILGKRIEELFPNEEKLVAMEMIRSTAAGHRLELIEIDIQHIDGTIKSLEWNTANIYDSEKKEIIATIAQGHDITIRKKALEELQSIKAKLEQKVAERTAELEDKVKKLDKSQQAMLFMVEDLNDMTAKLKAEQHKLEITNKELEAFSYSVSHDLRAPLRAIDGFSRFVVEDYSDKLDDEGKRLLKVIRENANKMDQLIADMLNLSRLSRKEMNYSTIEMHKIVDNIYNEIATVKEKDEFEVQIPEMPKVLVDVTLMNQVWQNLIGNALKYSAKSDTKRITIGYKEDENNYIFWIKDSGAGFNPKYSSKLFGAFQRLHSESEFPGTGIGLSIVQRIIHRHDGEVWAESELGKGAKFYFSIPKIKK